MLLFCVLKVCSCDSAHSAPSTARLTHRHCGVSATSQDLIQSVFKRSPFCLPYHLSSRLRLISSLIVPLISLLPHLHPDTSTYINTDAQLDVCTCVCAHMYVRTHNIHMSSSEFCHLSQVSHQERCKWNQSGLCTEEKDDNTPTHTHTLKTVVLIHQKKGQHVHIFSAGEEHDERTPFVVL